MMKISRNETGFSAVEVVILVVVVIAVGLVGYKLYQNNHTTKNSAPPVSTTSRSNTTFPSSIKNTSDVKQASAALKAQPISSQLNPTQLDSYITKML